MDLNLRKADEKLVRKLKVKAAAQGVTLRQYCLDRLAEGIAQQMIEMGPPKELVSGSPVTIHKPIGIVGQKCPHNYMNAYVCPECNPR
jgi:hypothetical protein